MLAIVKVPRNDTVLRQFGTYRSELNVGGRATEIQRLVRGGLQCYEPSTLATLLTLVQVATPRPVEFFDVGAHIGMHSLVVSTVFPADTVHVTAFEPTPRTTAICRSLAAVNQRPLRIERCALSDYDGTAELYISAWETSNSLAAGFRSAQDVIKVPATRLDSYCAANSVLPSVVKIDVETYELPVVRGAMRTFEQARPSIVCEILPDAGREAAEQTVAAFGSLGYRMHRFVGEGWIECRAEDIVEQVEHEGKDWLFLPHVLDDHFRSAFAEWQTAISDCTEGTTRTLDADRSTTAPARYPAPS